MPAEVLRAEELRVGLSAEFEREITEADVLRFAELSGDLNPLHVDPAYARDTNYKQRIVHGAFQVGLASAMAGMHLPGRNVLLGSVQSRFPRPLHFPSRVAVRGEITAWNDDTLGGALKVTVRPVELTSPTAEVAIGFTLHEQAKRPSRARLVSRNGARPAGRGTVLVTGASGGLGTAIAAELAKEYAVVGVTYRHPLAEALRSSPAVSELRTDLMVESWREEIEKALGDRPLYAVVHSAWPGVTSGGLLASEDAVIERQLNFGVSSTIRLARVLYSLAPAEGGRLVVLSSISASMKPSLAMAPYTLGKSALEAAVRLLAPELARKKITINAICPSLVPAGMNEQMSERQRLREAAQIPLGRLCRPEDVAGAVRYLLSPEAEFVSGQMLGLTGGQL